MDKEEKRNISFIDRIKARLEHIWYYYKWILLIGAAAVILVVVVIAQVIMKKNPDINILVCSADVIAVNDANLLVSGIMPLMDDYNGDGEKNVNIKNLNALSFNATDSNNSKIEVFDVNDYNTIVKEFNIEVSVGDSFIYILDEHFYLMLKEKDILSPLDNIVELPVGAELYDDYAVRLGSLDVSNKIGFSSLDKDMLVCMRKSPAEDAVKYGRTQESYNYSLDLLTNILSYTE